MVNPRSNISASLHKKRQASLMRKIFAYFVFLLFFISLAVLGLTTDKVRIKEVVISGNYSISTSDIMRSVNNEMNKYYLWIIPTDNILLLRRKEIKNSILDVNKKIGSANIYTDGINKITIAIVERETSNLWCTGSPSDKKGCYFMDPEGLIFDGAPKFSSDFFPKYFGLVATGSPIGQYYLKDNFKNVSSLFSVLKKMSFEPQYFNALTDKEYEIYILGGGKILMNNTKDFESALINLQALISNGYIKNDAESLKKIKYIDLRFGKKVNFELVK